MQITLPIHIFKALGNQKLQHGAMCGYGSRGKWKQGEAKTILKFYFDIKLSFCFCRLCGFNSSLSEN